MSSPDPAREPTAAMRLMARNIREAFLALTAEGFTKSEALIIVGQLLAAAVAGNQSKPDT